MNTVMLPRALLIKPLVVVVVLLASWGTNADWQLDNSATKLSFISVKATDVAEVHSFKQLSGSIKSVGEASGELNLSIQLASVDTLIPLRDSRVRELLFETVKFPTADLHGHLPLAKLTTIGVGDSREIELSLMLSLHGKKVPVSARVLVLRLAADRVVVTSQHPVIVNVQDFELSQGLEALRAVAGLPNISKAVPVSFVFSFLDR